MSDHYILNEDGIPVPTDALTWAESFSAQRRVADDFVGHYWISTVFLGLDHSFGDGPPLIFETMVFPATDGQVTDWGEIWMRRASTRELALDNHRNAIAMATSGDFSE